MWGGGGGTGGESVLAAARKASLAQAALSSQGTIKRDDSATSRGSLADVAIPEDA